ncbi:MAG: spore cortex biosynthesis protein YabQ [Oscillospiraceae bacterium]|nr:spore cortex biosynthesis protein YabQ [Oscillospiraceae bacterium]
MTISAQTISVTAAALGGLCAGLLYDLLRAIRRGGSPTAGLVCDLVFCLCCTFLLFVIGMAFCEGRLGIWECGAFLGLFALYITGVSPSVEPFFGNFKEKCKKRLKKEQQTTE